MDLSLFSMLKLRYNEVCFRVFLDLDVRFLKKPLVYKYDVILLTAFLQQLVASF